MDRLHPRPPSHRGSPSKASDSPPHSREHSHSQPATRRLSKAALNDAGHGIKAKPVFTPQEVALEEPEPIPHNSNAEPEVTPMAGAAAAAGGLDIVRSGLGIMRTSRVRQPSQLRLQRQAEAEAYALTFKPRARKAGASRALASVHPALLGGAGHHSEEAARVDEDTLESALDLPAERDAGNVEYKWKLVHKSANRVVHLTTQMAYRLSEGGGECLYELGVQDDGYAQGLPESELEESIECVLNMARTLKAEASVITRARGQEGMVAEVRVRRIGEVGGVDGEGRQGSDGEARSTAHDRMKDGAHANGVAAAASSGVSSRTSTSTLAPGSNRCPCATASPSPSSSSPLLSSSSCDLRLALIGNSSSGKSSLLGCLVSNQRDDGRGRARLHVVRHRHEVERGRSSAIARQVLGFDEWGGIVNYRIHHTHTLGSRPVVTAAGAPSPFSTTPATSTAKTAAAAAVPTPPAPLAASKKEKALTSLFGGGDTDDDDDDDESDDDDGGLDFGFETIQSASIKNNNDDDDTLTGSSVGAQEEPLVSFASGALIPCDDTNDSAPICSANDWQRILERSHKVYTLFDMPGHADSSRTTIYGLIGTSCPDYVCIVVSCNGHAANEQQQQQQGVTTAAVNNMAADSSLSPDAQEQRALAPVVTAATSTAHQPPLISSLTREQILICAALHLPFLLLVCKADLASADARTRIVRALHSVCADASVPPRDVDTTGAPEGALIITHKIPLLLTPPPVPSSVEGGSGGEGASDSAVAAAAAVLDASMALLERNQVQGVRDEDIPMLLRPIIRRTLTRARSSGSSHQPAATPAVDTWYPPHTFTPLLLISNATGEGMDLFKRLLHRLHNYRRDEWDRKIRRPLTSQAPRDPTNDSSTSHSPAAASAPVGWESVGVEFSIDEVFTVDRVGSVVSGTILSGVIHEGDTLLLGPLPASAATTAAATAEGTPLPLLPPVPAHWPAWCHSSPFRPVLVKSLQLSRKYFKNARAGQSVTLALKRTERSLLRRGMVLLSVPAGYGDGGAWAVPRPFGSNVTLQPPRSQWPRACVGFEAYIRLFDPHQHHHQSTGRALRDAQHGGGSHSSGSGLNRRRLLSSSAGDGLSQLLRGQPIIHVGNVRQGGEVVWMRTVRFRSAQSHQAVERWMSEQEERGAARDVDQAYAEGEGDLATLIDRLEHEEAVAETLADASSSSQSPLLPAAPPLYALVRFDFLYQSEYLRLGRAVLFRDERTRGTGRITNLFFVDDSDEEERGDAAADVTGTTAKGAAGSEMRNNTASPKRRASPPSVSSTPSPVTRSAGVRKQRLHSSPPLPSKSVSPSTGMGHQLDRSNGLDLQAASPSRSPLSSSSPVSAAPVLSAFQRTKERRALERRHEALAAAARELQQHASNDEAADSVHSSGTSTAVLPHSQSHTTIARSHRPVVSQSQHGSAMQSSTASPAVQPTRAHAASTCTPLMLASSSSAPWSTAAAQAHQQLACDQLELTQSAAV